MNASNSLIGLQRWRLWIVPLVLVAGGMGTDDGPAPEPKPAARVEPAAGRRPMAVAVADGTFESHGKTIAVERFTPKEPGKYPVVVILHGSGGMTVGGFLFRGLARELAARGYLVVLPHYFDRTGTTIADPKAILDRFQDWLETVGDAMSYAAALPDADGGRIGLVGYSLGGYLATSEAVFDARVKVVVEYFGGLPDLLADRASKLPPTLILHGDADVIVPVSEAHELEERLKAVEVPYEIKIYEGANHGFLGTTAQDANRRTAAFLGKHLSP